MLSAQQIHERRLSQLGACSSAPGSVMRSIERSSTLHWGCFRRPSAPSMHANAAADAAVTVIRMPCIGDQGSPKQRQLRLQLQQQAQHGDARCIAAAPQPLSPPPHPSHITVWIKDCSTWHAAQLLFARYRRQLNHIHISALLTRLAQLHVADSRGSSAEAEGQWPGSCSGESLPCSSSSGVDGGSGGGSSGGEAGNARRPATRRRPTLQRLQQLERAGLVTSLLADAVVLLPACAPRQLSNMAWAAAKLRQRPPADFLNAWQLRLAATLASANPRDVSNVWWALATLRLPPPPRLQQELLSATHRHALGGSCAQDVANTLWALATLRLAPSAELLQGLQAAAQLVQSELQPQERATLLWAVGALHMRCGCAAPAAGWVQQLLAHVARSARDDAPRHLVMLLVACARLRQRPPPQWLSACLRALQPALPSCSPQDLANLSWALGTLRCRPMQPWLATFAAACVPRLPAAQPAELASLLWGMAKLGIQPEQDWLTDFDHACSAAMPGFGVRELAELAAARAHLGLAAAPPLWADAWRRALRAGWRSADAAGVSKSLWAAAKLRLGLPRPWLASALDARLDVLEQMGCEEGARLSWALVHLRAAPSAAAAETLALRACQLASGGASGAQLLRLAWGVWRMRGCGPPPRLLLFLADLAECRARGMDVETAAAMTLVVEGLRARAQPVAPVRGVVLAAPAVDGAVQQQTRFAGTLGEAGAWQRQDSSPSAMAVC